MAQAINRTGIRQEGKTNGTVTTRWKPKRAVTGALFACLALASPLQAIELDASPELKKVTDGLVQSSVYSQSELEQMFSALTLDQGVLKLMDRQAEAKPWHEYKRIFLNEKRIAQGVVFWEENTPLIEQVSKEYGVPEKILVALLGVETYYGKRMGAKQVLRSLATLTAGYPRRAKFFGRELDKFLRLLKSEQLVAKDVEGSYAGAIGIPQFMPTSYDAYAVDFNTNGKRDLVQELPDALGSVGNYLAVHGWQRDAAIREWVGTSLPKALTGKISKKAKPNVPISTLRSAGLTLEESGSEKGALARLKDDDGDRFFVGYQNFYALTRYNPSNKYAMAICELADLIEARLAQ